MEIIGKILADGEDEILWRNAYTAFGGPNSTDLEVGTIERNLFGEEYEFEFSALLNNAYDTVIVLGEMYTSRTLGERQLVSEAFISLNRQMENEYMAFYGKIANQTYQTMNS